MRICILIVILPFLFLSCGQEQSFDLEKEKKIILELHNKQREYHFEKDSVSFANQLSKNFISVNRGKITHPEINETISRYHSYFSSVEFENWDDVSEPIIRFSEDGTLAYTIVDKVVKTAYLDENGIKQSGSTHFAWTAIYKKYDDQWKIDCVTSTEKASE